MSRFADRDGWTKLAPVAGASIVGIALGCSAFLRYNDDEPVAAPSDATGKHARNGPGTRLPLIVLSD